MDKLRIKSSILNGFSWVIVFVWSILVLLDYFNKHPGYVSSWEYFQYKGLYIFLCLFVSAIILHYRHPRWFKRKIPVNGISLSIFLLILSFALINAHKDYTLTHTRLDHVLSFLANGWIVIAYLFFFCLMFASFGRLVYGFFLKNYIEEDYLLDIAIGCAVFILGLFILGVFGLIKMAAVLLMIAVFTLSNIKYFWRKLVDVFTKRIDISSLNAIGILSFCVLTFYLLMNLLYSISPFPSGFDSRNFYVNISKLLAESHYLVEGYQPYFWSLLMSTGFVLNDNVELAIGLSYLGIILVVLAAYRLGVKIFAFDKNMVLFMLALFVLTPAVSNQMYIEMKVDFAMLFYQILCLSYVIKLIRKMEDSSFNTSIKANVLDNFPLILIIGLLSSFTLGIKMINMFMVFTILVMIWWNRKDIFASIGILCFSLLLFLVAGVDELSGLNKYHLSVDTIKLVFLVVALLGYAISLFKNRVVCLSKTYLTGVYLMACGVFLIPWIIKSYNEVRTLDPKVLIMGKTPGPDITIREIINNYNKSKRSKN